MIFSVLALETINTSGVVTGTLMLTDNAEYAVQAVDLGIAARKRSALGGASPYVDVPVTMTLHVLGSTASLCAAAMERLVTTIAQARRWANRENVDGVRMRMRLNGGANDYTCMLLGPEDGSPPTTYQIEEVVINGVNLFAVLNVEVTLWRRGLLYKATAEIATSAATAAHQEGTLTFADDPPFPTPVSISVASTIDSGGGSEQAGERAQSLYVFANHIVRIPAQNLSATSGSTVAESAAKRSVTGTILRVTDSGVASIALTTPLAPDAFKDWRSLDVFATVRANTSGVAWRLQAKIVTPITVSDKTADVVLSYDSGNTAAIHLGRIAVPTGIVDSALGHGYLYLDIERIGGAGSLDIDSIYIVRSDRPMTILAFRFINSAGAAQGFVRGGLILGTIRPGDHNAVAPVCAPYFSSEAVDLGSYGWSGDVFLAPDFAQLFFVFLDMGSGGAWRPGQPSGYAPPYAPYTDTVTATRYPAAITPQ